MGVTRRSQQKKTAAKSKRRGRSGGPPLIVDLAHFLNLDLAKCEIEKRWHYFQSWPRFGIATGDVTAADLVRYAELKLLVTLLEERDIHPKRADLIEHLQSLQDDIKLALRPILRTSPKAKEQKEINYEIRRGLEELVARINRYTYRSRWAIFSDNVGDPNSQLRGWHCTYDPESPNRVEKVEGSILAQQKVLHLGKYRFVVKEIAPGADSIADRLYWIIGQTLIDATISRLKTCVKCDKYFSAYDSKQVVCGAECREQYAREGAAERVKQWRIDKAKKAKANA